MTARHHRYRKRRGPHPVPPHNDWLEKINEFLDTSNDTHVQEKTTVEKEKIRAQIFDKLISHKCKLKKDDTVVNLNEIMNPTHNKT